MFNLLLFIRPICTDIQNTHAIDYVAFNNFFKEANPELIEEDIQTIVKTVLNEYNGESVPDINIYKSLFTYLLRMIQVLE